MTEGIQRLHTATLVIGVTGAGKTSLAATMAEYLWETYRRVLVLASCDGGAFPTLVQARVKQGLIRPWRLRTRSAEGLAYETCYMASRGYLPAALNPATGECAPAAKLVPPVTVRYTLRCPKGHTITVTTQPQVKNMMCPGCKALVTPAEISVEEQAFQTPGFEAIGSWYYDGLTSMSNWFMSDMDERRGRGEISGEGTALGKDAVIVSGSLRFGGTNRSDYGFAQSRIRQIVNNVLGIPHLVEGPVFTALTYEVPELGERLGLVGPQLVGKAMLDSAPQWFGNVYEAAVVQGEDGLPRRRLYLQQWVDDERRRHLLKNSSSGSLPPYVEDVPGQPKFSGFHLGKVFAALDQDLQQTLDDAPETDIPGIVATPTTYGVPDEAPAPEPAAPPAVVTPTPVPRAVPKPAVTRPASPAVVAAPATSVTLPAAPVMAPGPSAGIPPPPGKPPRRAPGQ